MTDGADELGGAASPSVPHVTVTTAGVDPAVRTRSPAGLRGRHVTTPAAAQQPAGPRTPPGAMTTWRGELQTVSVRLPCRTRRASRGPERPELATSAQHEEPGPGPRGPGRGAVRAGRARGARVWSGGPRAGITRRRRGALAERRLACPLAGPRRPSCALTNCSRGGQCREQDRGWGRGVSQNGTNRAENIEQKSRASSVRLLA
jgi:hypothetical protein